MKINGEIGTLINQIVGYEFVPDIKTPGEIEAERLAIQGLKSAEEIEAERVDAEEAKWIEELKADKGNLKAYFESLESMIKSQSDDLIKKQAEFEVLKKEKITISQGL